MQTEVVTLSAFDFELQIAPEAGGGIAALNWRDLPLLRPAVPGGVARREPRDLASFPMTPYASRIVDGIFAWKGVTTQIPPNMQGGAHPLHGVGWHSPWTVTHSDATSVRLSLDHAGDENWPWACRSTQSFVVHTDHVEHVLSLTNTDTRPFPASLGPHPYFNAADAIISFEADALWEITGESLPSHLARTEIVAALATGVAASNLRLDHCFEGWSGRARIAWPTHRLDIHAEAQLDDRPMACTRLQLYTPADEGYFCLEPVTARGVAFTAEDPYALGVVELTNQTLSITTRFYPAL